MEEEEKEEEEEEATPPQAAEAAAWAEVSESNDPSLSSGAGGDGWPFCAELLEKRRPLPAAFRPVSSADDGSGREGPEDSSPRRALCLRPRLVFRPVSSAA